MDVSSLYMSLEELMAIFGYTSKRNVYRCIRENRFPVPVIKFQGKWVADIEVVKRYFEIQRERAFEELDRRANAEYEHQLSRSAR